MEAKHVFIKGRFGHGIFYRNADLLVFITMASVVARSMGLTVLAFCPMFNHVHILFKDIDEDSERRFIIRLETAFVREYNKEYSRKGPLFQRPYGRSLKKGAKIILGCVAYICNNPVAGKLCARAMDYRWNLLAYHDSSHPFSDPLAKKSCGNVLRLAFRKVDYFRSSGRILSYGALNSLFKGLSTYEARQLTDYIVSKYNFLSYESLSELYGSIDRMRLAVDSNAGAEFEIEDDFGDHSCYRKMLALVRRFGYDGKRMNFESISPEEYERLFRMIRSGTWAHPTSIKKFLHHNAPDSNISATLLPKGHGFV